MPKKLQLVEIPHSGSVHNFVVTKVGAMKIGEESVPGMMCVIDTGRYKGRRVSAQNPDERQVGHRFSAILDVIFSAKVDGRWQTVTRDYNESNPRIRYSIRSLAPPTEPAEHAPPPPRQKFHRR